MAFLSEVFWYPETHSDYTICHKENGCYGKAKTSNKANKPLKALLHNGAMSAIQHSQELKAYYIRKTAEGKNEMLVINNVCNKLIHRVFACVQRKEKYKEFYSPVVA